ncbi:hypothetical protein L596_020565 [Steinernema carpocapsae]|uniref:G-protein coupled receptors family 1 profile domain-containing protein n=1 Tax=Steinernema carpocapsae TaxID=34508 RepID=A0A4U5MTZ7_STECR|nr:hypothetical protein L596_020565 [Steinernema carpocapsae]
MELFLFRPDEWEATYSCSNHSDEFWQRGGYVNKPLGIWYLVSGVIYMIPYIPCLVVMLKHDLFKNSCYKIMFYLGLIDFITLGINAVLTGFLTIHGAVFCTYPRLIYVAGCMGMSLWCMACLTCVLLAFNRCIDLWEPKIMWTLFAEHKTYLWLSLPIIYFLYFFLFTTPVLYTSKGFAWFFDPYYGIPKKWQDVDRDQFMNPSHSTNNIVVIILLPLLYAFLCASLCYKARNAHSENVSTIQKKMLVQSCSICTFNLIASAIYVIMQFVETDIVFVVIGQITWQASHGGAAIVYLTLNQTIRRRVIRMVTIGRWNGSRVHVTHTDESHHHHYFVA